MRWQWCVIVAGLVGACDSGAPPPPAKVTAPVKTGPELVAEHETEQAAQMAVDADAKVEAVGLELVALDNKIAKAVDAVVGAQTDAERATAKAELQQLQKAKVDLEARFAAAKAAAARAERAKGVHISKECLANPLAKGCS